MDGNWIESFGYWAIFIGGVFEGEAVFIAAGYAISQGYLDAIPVYAAAVTGAAAGDIAYFLLGRWAGPRILVRFPRLRPLRVRAQRLIRRWGRATAFLARFAYGLRVVLPMSLGAARLPVALFVPINLAASLLFAALYLSAGYLFGEAIEQFVGRFTARQPWILFAIAAVGLAMWAAREWWLLRSNPGPDLSDPPAGPRPGEGAQGRPGAAGTPVERDRGRDR